MAADLPDLAAARGEPVDPEVADLVHALLAKHARGKAEAHARRPKHNSVACSCKQKSMISMKTDRKSSPNQLTEFESN